MSEGDRHARFLGTGHFGSLDGLRALSIVPVVWHHATPRPLDGVLGRGPLGVDLFFAISGFLITTLLLREREARGTIAMGAFYARRSLRIFPLYYLTLGAFVLHALVLREPGPARDHFFASLPAHATYTSNWLVDCGVPHPIVFAFSWSLAAEEQFYLVWPWIVRAARGLAIPAVAMGGLLLLDQAAERGWLAELLGAAPLALRVLRSLATPICLGSLLALALRARATFRVLDATLGARVAAPLALAILVASAVLAWPLLVAHAAMAALVGAVVLRPDHALRRPLEARAVRHVGAVSYGVYLLNVPVVSGAKRLLSPGEAGGLGATLVVFASALVASVLLATLAHRLVDGPLAPLRARFRPAPAQRSLSGPSFHADSSGTLASGPDCRTTRAHSSTVSRRGPNGDASDASESISRVGVSTP